MSCSGRLKAIRFSCNYWQPLTNTTNIEIEYPTNADAAKHKSAQHQPKTPSAVILGRGVAWGRQNFLLSHLTDHCNLPATLPHYMRRGRAGASPRGF
jgi:hypothetical protein